MFGDRQQLRGMYRQVWLKMQEQQPLEGLESAIAGIIAWHPEYHELLKSEEMAQSDFNVDGGEGNPFLHMGLHMAIQEQLGTGQIPELLQVHQTLSQKLGPHGAEHQIMECLGQWLWKIQQGSEQPDVNDYIECLRKLM